MALVHEKLYQSADVARVDFAQYVENLLGYLWRAHGAAASGVRLIFNLEPISLSINAAVPCGLILNELATNALKHAFRGRSDGEVVISLSVPSADGVCLACATTAWGYRPAWTGVTPIRLVCGLYKYSPDNFAPTWRSPAARELSFRSPLKDRRNREGNSKYEILNKFKWEKHE